MFGFLQKHHNSQLQNETSATAVSVVLVECHKWSMLHRASKNIQKYIFHRWYSVKSKLQTTICPFTIVPRRNRLVHRRYLVKSKLCNVTDLSALYQVGFSHPLSMRGQYGVFVQYVVQSMQCNPESHGVPFQSRKNLVLWHTCNRRSWRSSSSLARYWISE